MDELIFERTGAQPGSIGGYFKLNPQVDDIPERFSATYRDIHLLRMGTIKIGGTGCLCPENALLKALTTHLFMRRDEVLILDMEAGVEHLGRATAQAVDAMVIVVEPGRRSVGVMEEIRRSGRRHRPEAALSGGQQGARRVRRGVHPPDRRRPACARLSCPTIRRSSRPT